MNEHNRQEKHYIKDQIDILFSGRTYDAKRIREYLRKRNITYCIPYRNFKTRRNNPEQIQQDMWWKDSLHGSNAGSTELESGREKSRKLSWICFQICM